MSGRRGRGARRRRPLNARAACVSHLDVVDRVLGILTLGEFQVEFHLAVNRLGEKEVARGGGSHLVEHLAQRHEAAAALAGARQAVAAAHPDHLRHEDLELRRVKAQRLHRGLHPRHVTLVVGAPNVDHQVEFALAELALVIGDVGGEVGGVPARPHQHVFAVIRSLAPHEPGGALAVCHVPRVGQRLQHSRDIAAGSHLALRVPHVEVDTQVGQVALD